MTTMIDSVLHFSWPDYLIFSLTLLSSLLIGIYHAWKGAANSTANYMLGGKKMAVFPIAMSLASSMVSTQTMLGMPTDVYLTGSMMFWTAIAAVIGTFNAVFIFLPFFQKLGVLSINEYLEIRFHRLVRRVFSVISLFGTLFYLSMLTYGPSLALSQVTGLHVYVCTTITFVVCTFYTTIGGIKAVVWSDTIQIFLMFGSVTALVVKGILDIGIENVWERNVNSSRIEFFNIDPDPRTQKTIWSMLIGGGISWSGWYGINQGNYQRFLAVPSRRQSRMAFFINLFTVGIFVSLCCFTGLLAYAKYFDCDPLKAKIIFKADQILPYFVMDTLGSFPGLPGLFIAGIFSASLSTLSTVLNSIALLILEDFVRPCLPKLTDKSSTRISKCISFGIGLIAYCMVFLVSNVQSILETGWSISGATTGMTMGVFILGMLIPWSNAIGAIVGSSVSYLAVLILGIYTQAARSQGLLPNNQMKPRSIENCIHFNYTLENSYPQGNRTQTIRDDEDVFSILSISYMWYTIIGIVITLVIGTVVSIVSCPQDPGQLDPKLVFPFLRRWIGKNRLLDEKEHDKEKANIKLLES